MKTLRIILLACAAQFAAIAAYADPVARGRALVQANCARCHAIDKTDASPLRGAPPLREVIKIYSSDDIAEAFAEGIVTGHPDMPEFVFPPEEIGALIAYLESLEN
jgi:mono/diheme cytochrome c family protein